MNDIEKAINFYQDEVENLPSGFINFNDTDRETYLRLQKTVYSLEKQLNNGWIPISSGQLPESEERVLICADRKSCSGKIIQIRTTGMYEDGTMHTEDSGYCWEDNDFEYCEETDDYIIPEGWYEQSMYCEEFGIVDDFVTAWQPLPEKYKAEQDFLEHHGFSEMD